LHVYAPSLCLFGLQTSNQAEGITKRAVFILDESAQGALTQPA